MYSRWFQVAVVGLWLATMAWLFSQKILPALLRGEPPSAQELAAARKQQPLAGWTLLLNEEPLGWAVSKVVESPTELTEIRSWVHIDHLPLGRSLPGWLRTIWDLVEQPSDLLQLDTENVVEVDSLGHLVRIESTISFNAYAEAVRLEGEVEEGQLVLTVRSGGVKYGPRAYPLRHTLLGDSLSPQTQLPKLHVGQQWTVRSYNPLKPHAPIEIHQATVEQSDPIKWNGQIRAVRRVVFRPDPGSSLGGDEQFGVLWVDRDGTVLKQQVTFLGTKMTFIRLTEEESQRLENRVLAVE